MSGDAIGQPVNRRAVLGAAAAFTVVPRQVLGGRGYLSPTVKRRNLL